MNKIRNVNITIIIIIIASYSCDSFLEEMNPVNLTPENYYNQPEHAEAALASIYADIRFIGNPAGHFSANWQLLEALTGTSITESAENTNLNNLYSLVFESNNIHINQWWNGLYKVIAQSNLVIDKVPDIPSIDEGLKSKILGEAKFLRAWAYFYAVRLWGDIPLIVEPQTASSENFFPSRTGQKEIYSNIIDDLKAAEASGLSWMVGSGRVSLAAIKAQLAKVYLTMAGYPLNMGMEYYELASKKSQEIIDYANNNPSEIGLFSSYSNLRNVEFENRKEHLFMIQFSNEVGGNPRGIYMLPNFKPVATNLQGVGTTVPTIEFYNSYESGDLRAIDREGFFYSKYYENGSGELFDLGAPYIFKFFNETAYGTKGQPGTGRNDLNVPEIRYAEVLLIYAEANNELNGPNIQAYDSFNKIRDRAMLSTQPLNSFTQNSFREAIWRERWHELCFEGITWFDMVRLRKVYNEKTDGFDDFIGHVNLSSNQMLQEKHLLLPLGFQESQNNPNLRPQNPGY